MCGDAQPEVTGFWCFDHGEGATRGSTCREEASECRDARSAMRRQHVRTTSCGRIPRAYCYAYLPADARRGDPDALEVECTRTSPQCAAAEQARRAAPHQQIMACLDVANLDLFYPSEPPDHVLIASRENVLRAMNRPQQTEGPMVTSSMSGGGGGSDPALPEADPSAMRMDLFRRTEALSTCGASTAQPPLTLGVTVAPDGTVTTIEFLRNGAPAARSESVACATRVVSAWMFSPFRGAPVRVSAAINLPP